MSLITNTKATFNYEIIDRYEAGIELFGHEVKSLRNKHGKLDGSYVRVKHGEAYLVGADIPPYQPANTDVSYNRLRDRKLILKKNEILSLKQKTEKDGLTLIPISWYNKGRKIKVELAVARGKKKFDKRETTKKREDSREMLRHIKGER